MTALATPDAPLVWEAVTRRSPAARSEHRPATSTADPRPAGQRRGQHRRRRRRRRPPRDRRGGRRCGRAPRERGPLVYVGAGTSGRIAAADAAECGPTFSTDRLRGDDDDDAEEDATASSRSWDVGEQDVVLGVSASGRTPYTLGALERARDAGALTIGLACARGSELARVADLRSSSTSARR